MKILTIVQARSGSSRLPGKILKSICGKTLLELQLERMQQSHLAGQIIVATTREANDDIIQEICEQNNTFCFRGHSSDLLDRHYKAAIAFKPDAVIKVPSDCPLIDPKVIDLVIQEFINDFPEYDYVSNLHPATFPDGNDVEIMKFSALHSAWKEAEKDFEFEHTTPYIWEHPNKFKIKNVVWNANKDYSMTHRFTLDYEEDFLFIKSIYENLYSKNKKFSLDDILQLLNNNPNLLKINQKYNGVNWYRNHLDELHTITAKQTKII